MFDNSNVNNDKQIKQKIANFFLQTFQNYQIFLSYPSERSHFGIKSYHSSLFLLHASKTFFTVELFSIFSQTFFGTKFSLPKANSQLSTKYCVYYVSEHLKYCLQINEYWFNKNVCVNIVLHAEDMSNSLKWKFCLFTYPFIRKRASLLNMILRINYRYQICYFIGPTLD